VSTQTDTATVEDVADQVPDVPEFEEKPRLRGVIHASMTLLVIAGGVALILLSHSWSVRLACVVYMVCAMELFTVSAVFHLGRWRPNPRRVLRQIDHSNIFIFIAGTYTPLAVALLTGWSRVLLLVLIWVCAVVGVAMGALELKAPRWVTAGLYVVMGWIAVGWLPAMWHAGPAIVILVIVGGVIYTSGAVVYARKSPNPAPDWFGFHEIFHSMTVVAAICHWIAIALAVTHI